MEWQTYGGCGCMTMSKPYCTCEFDAHIEERTNEELRLAVMENKSEFFTPEDIAQMALEKDVLTWIDEPLHFLLEAIIEGKEDLSQEIKALKKDLLCSLYNHQKPFDQFEQWYLLQCADAP